MTSRSIWIAGLSKRYRNGTLALDRVDLSVNGGELLALLGPNGAGKTTLVRQLTTELHPSAGLIEVMGIDALRYPHRVKQLMGVVPQQAELFEHLRVEQHLHYFALFRGMPRADAKLATQKTLRELGLDDYGDTQIKNLSGGLKRRVLVGIALLADPPILVLDEPTAGLDPESRRALWQLLGRRKQQGATIILTTHYLEEAECLADRIGLLRQGRLVGLGKLSELRARATRTKVGENDSRGLSEVYFQLAEGDLEKIS